ncbi:LacI family DNA-binding transcriptional regulator [Sphingomonas sp. ERG5]|uniref:LacI family DNA-binding transcriptional regulator n=1 Tax=Sphingomonas sp. ERG5 TaxID=1381597 RepID=UPI002286C65A|nr:LacI family DNA-binding transcriptional regulator [Sphingomonas sp. ERG5]
MAKVTGVSPKTVSRALNDVPHVSPAVRKKVKEAAAALDYHPNIAAQSLIARRTFLIGLTYERPSPSYVVELQKGAIDRLENERYRLVVLPFGDVASRPAELGQFLVRAGLDGVLLAPPACDQPEVLDILERQKLAYARITPHQDLDRGIVIVMDECHAARDVAAHLLKLGHRRIGIIMGDPSHSASAARMAGYRQAFAAAGVSIDENLIVRGDFTYDKGHEAALILLSRRPAPTAILAQNDDMAVAAMAAARASGLSVPDDLSVAGFDNSEISRTAWPQLTTVHQPVHEMAWEATNLLIAALESGDVASCRRDRRHEVLARGSTAAPAG